MKRFFRSIHLYLSLAVGLVIMTCCFSGAVLVFEKDLQQLFNSDRYFVQQQDERLSLTQLIGKVRESYPSAKIGSVKVYADAERSVEIGISLPTKGGGEKGEGNSRHQAKNKHHQCYHVGE